MSCSLLRRSLPLVPLFRSYATAAALQELKPSHYGQPLRPSHPHLVNADHLTPGIPSSDYESRRRSLMESLPNNSLVVALSAPVKFMSNNIFYKYRQASDFWYLTGFEEPDSAVVLEKTSSSRGYRMTLFCHGKDASKEKWDGPKTSFDDAAMIFRADNALPIAQFPTYLRSAIAMSSHVFLDVPSDRKRSKKNIMSYLVSGIGASDYDWILESLKSSLQKPLAPQVARLRAVKSPAEQSAMRAAADTSGRAHAKTMRFTRQGLSESALAAHFEYICALCGSERPAYVPVVASGANSLIIHYTSNNQLVKEGELILVDAGCELHGYASDITRTYPVSGVFTPPQRDLYTAVLNTQKTLVELCTEANSISLHNLHRKSCQLLQQELKQISFTASDRQIESILYPHFVGHPIGIDLHESSHFDRSAPMRAGMVITVEPGIYVPPMPEFPKEFHNIGIRIEDDVLVGEQHPINLSVNAPKELADVEGACQGLLGFESF